jgi:hypothetical protein
MSLRSRTDIVQKELAIRIAVADFLKAGKATSGTGQAVVAASTASTPASNQSMQLDVDR